MMTTTETPTEGTVHRIIDSGPDCIIAKPLSIKANHRSPDAKDLKMLRTVSLAIYKAFQRDENIAELSHDIAASIGASRRYAAH